MAIGSIKIGTAWTRFKAVYCRDAGIWRPIKSIYRMQSGSWVRIWGGNTGTVSWTTPGTYSITIPDGVYSITITACGGAGGGGGGDWGSNYNYPGGAGGGGANLITQTRSVIPGTVLTVVVGNAGAGGPLGGDGFDGTASTVTGNNMTAFSTGFGTRGGGTRNSYAGIGADGANNGSTGIWGNAPGGTSTNGGANGGNGGSYQQGGASGQPGKVTITY